MPHITVYAFKYYSAAQDDWFLGEGKRPWDEIGKKGWRAIEESAEEIDASRLNDDGVYHPDRD